MPGFLLQREPIGASVIARDVAKTLTPASVEALRKGSLADPITPGLFPAQTIAQAREWARGLNQQVEAGIDPREEQRHNSMNVEKAHGLYIVAVREGRSTRRAAMT
ncbi:integrase arm-type DNA-binding domain-containing protein [Novosphingobium beihaiensis]|uniref:integrase arm-type DNA-binding domain-containing protein n=1 Tax=Novosphingobium beihaiensis TaxID=2930389 RepID=UPI0038990035